MLAGNLIDERHGGPITSGYGRYAPGQSIDETLAVDDVMVVLEGRHSVSTDAGAVTAGPGKLSVPFVGRTFHTSQNVAQSAANGGPRSTKMHYVYAVAMKSR